MKKQITTFALFAILGLSGVFAQTSVPGGTVSGHWTVLGSPYNIMGSVTIPTLSTLTIDPGVTVSFQTSFGLTMIVQGRLLAVGTVADTITFTAANTTIGFSGIRFVDSYKYTGNDSSKFEYCKIQYGKDTTSVYLHQNGGAILFDNWSNAVISHCLVSDCNAGYSGGAIYCDSSSSPVIMYNTITNNSAVTTSVSTGNGGGGICCNNGSNPVISYNTISNNFAYDWGEGGGISCLNNSSPVITHNIISGNSIIYDGGGIACDNACSPLILYNTISNNSSAYYGGGGIYINSSTIPIISQNTISNNTGGTNYGGGGIFCNQSNIATLSYNNISNNSSAYLGGGILCYNSSSISTMSNNIISNNLVTYAMGNSEGGGIYCGINSSIDSISNTSITNNSAINGNGGGFYCSGTSPFMLNVTIANNYANLGGALYCDVAAKPNLYNCILWNDTTATPGGGNEMFQNDAPSAPSFYYCDVQGGEAAFQIGANFYIGTYANNITAIPMFVSPSAATGYLYNGVSANWGLQTGSPGIDAGKPLAPNAPYYSYPSTDLAGNPRIVICRIDMGAYENQYGASAPLNVGISGTTSICPHSSTTLTAGGATTYTWSPSTGLSLTNIANPVATPTVNTTYTVIGTSGACLAIDTVRITIITVDTSVMVSADSLTANTPTATYQWLNCPAMTPITGATNQSYTATANGNYAVIVTQNACSDTSSCYTISTVGIAENSLSGAISIYPNPVTDNLQMQTTLQIKNLVVTDITGRPIYTTASKTIDCSSFANGVYFIRAITEKGVIVKKFIKE